MKLSPLPINILVLFLQALAFFASWSWSGSDPVLWSIQIRNLSLLFLAGWLTQFFIRRFIEPTATFRMEHRMITTLILFLLFDPTSPWWYFPLVRIVTEGAQYLFRAPGGPLFNPAALGTVIVSFFGILPSWWGANQAPRFMILDTDVSIFAFFTLFIAGYVAYKYKKIPLILATLLSFIVSFFLCLGENPTPIVIEGTLLFYLLVMVPEPKTSPVLQKEQVIYGCIIGVLVSLGLLFHFTESYLTALLVGNLYTKRQFLRSLFD